MSKRNKKSPAKPSRQSYKNPFVSFETSAVGDHVQKTLEESSRDFLSAPNPFIRKRQPMKVDLAPLPAADETPDEVEERENPMPAWAQNGIEVVGGSLGGWMVAFLAASVVTSMSNGENPSPTMIRVVSYGSAAAPALVFSLFPKNPSTWKGALAGSALYPLFERLIASFASGPVTP